MNRKEYNAVNLLHKLICSNRNKCSSKYTNRFLHAIDILGNVEFHKEITILVSSLRAAQQVRLAILKANQNFHNYKITNKITHDSISSLLVNNSTIFIKVISL